MYTLCNTCIEIDRQLRESGADFEKCDSWICDCGYMRNFKRKKTAIKETDVKECPYCFNSNIQLLIPNFPEIKFIPPNQDLTLSERDSYKCNYCKQNFFFRV